MSERIRLEALLARTIVNIEVEAAEVFRPLGLMVGEEFHGGKIFEVLVVRNNFDGVQEPFKVVPPLLEGGEDGKEFFIIDVIVEFGRIHGVGEEGDRVEDIVGGIDLGEDSNNSI